MRALLPLLAALSTTAAASTPPPAPPPPFALLLRAACHAPLRAAFDETRLLDYEPARFLFSQYRVRLLSYEDTCGPEWRVSMTKQALAALSEGGSVVGSGCLGSHVCGALSAAARALRRPVGARCVGAEARGAAVARLAARLRWRLALVPPAAPASECEAALSEVARALAVAGLAVRRSKLSPEELERHPDVVILCTDRGTETVAAAAAVHGEGGAGPAALLVHVEECDSASPSVTETSRTSMDVNNATQISNITLVLSKLLKLRSKRHSQSEEITMNDFNTNLSSNKIEEMSAETRFLNQQPVIQYTGHHKINSDSVQLRSKKNEDKALIEQHVVESKHAVSEIELENWQRESTGSTREPDSDLNSDHLPQIEISFFRRLLLLTDDQLTKHSYSDETMVYDEILKAIEIESIAGKALKETFNINFHLYEKQDKTSSHWTHAAVLATTMSRSLELSDEQAISVQLVNVTVALDSWSSTGAAGAAGAAGAGREPTGAAALSAVAACGALALAASTALLLRWVATRRRRRRRRRDAVLTPSDFSFPVDERRRVGEGMETMLSCWLQQLHEFGGPELERPDLLKQPPCVAPRAPSAPSSTCSVNRVAVDRRIRYKGDVVHVKYLPATAGLELKRKATDVLLVMQNLRHENLNPFIGCLCDLRPALVFDQCGRGSLEDVLVADDIKLDWTFRLSLLTDLVKGMRYLHASPLRLHGRLTSRNCVVDSRWVLRVTDYGLPAFFHAQALPQPHRSARDLLWTAPELLRESNGAGRGSQPGDVFAFAIIMQEVIVRGEPYCMLALTPEEIVEKVSRPPPLIRPSVSMGAAPPDAVSVMRQCWSEAPDLRPDFHRLHDIFRHLHRGRKINIVDSMFEMLEKYSNNLEELIKERTEQLDMEKKKTEQLLNRMLPKSVAERLLLGSRVEPEEFSEVSIYFSDIVGFTALAARSTPVQVVDLLNDLYTTFDAAIEQYRVYKVETIGDAYMVVGGLPVRTRDHAEAVATMALHLLHLAGRFRLRHLPDTPLHLRIGLHTGPCCAAVVGLTMPRYCLFGDTVNTASRMESTGAAWRIQVSATTAERLAAAGGYRLRSRGLTMIKGKGAMHTYWLLGKDGFDKPLPTPPPLQSEEVLFEVDGENECESPAPDNSPPAAARAGVERQRSDPTGTPDRQAWTRSGAQSADGSPPPAPPAAAPATPPAAPPAPAAPVATATPAADHSVQYSRYRCLGNGRRPLRRQWSLERGDSLAAAAAAAPGRGASSAPPSPPEPLALLAPAAARPPAPRYRTRPEPDGTPAPL
ncbi:uncharacterized protein LOC118262627 [Spodoptera frugiperda]|uniref:guanylate cyclase n=1 Tax=Spodoptera frugiperda TaxID=7108 RepID=A0A9R0CUR4_SPOFR|nr:uncharacterized protein LOC118262627 [Spodoptera frugiperda]XP_035430040.2 uncharacterized protein LOC118262627 [Spodoptera frugiperda]XP_050553640.1 uncharacterized protein LOC118262627 [Spodoptera frugiperda]XP_050553641.1 uncharacterized protein LOC118262627 [Spodoptera frugiperda]